MRPDYQSQVRAQWPESHLPELLKFWELENLANPTQPLRPADRSTAQSGRSLHKTIANTVTIPITVQTIALTFSPAKQNPMDYGVAQRGWVIVDWSNRSVYSLCLLSFMMSGGTRVFFRRLLILLSSQKIRIRRIEITNSKNWMIISF
jgi:hypothetical protein